MITEAKYELHTKLVILGEANIFPVERDGAGNTDRAYCNPAPSLSQVSQTSNTLDLDSSVTNAVFYKRNQRCLL